jgi:MFS family permease
MTELSPSPLVVAAVQASTTLPIFMFALLAGAIADIVDRRRLLIVVNVALAAAAAALAALTAADLCRRRDCSEVEAHQCLRRQAGPGRERVDHPRKGRRLTCPDCGSG